MQPIASEAIAAIALSTAFSIAGNASSLLPSSVAGTSFKVMLLAIEKAVDKAIAAMASEAIGCMQVLLDTTIAYTKQRIQFGKPLADNQVLRHRMASMAVKLEEARASALNAVLNVDADPVARALAASGAKVKVGRAGRFIAEQAVQLHGGMGVTEELNVGVYFKRLMAIDVIFGSPEFHLQRHARLSRRQAA